MLSSPLGRGVPSKPGCIGVITRAGPLVASSPAKAATDWEPAPPCSRRYGWPAPCRVTVRSAVRGRAESSKRRPSTVLDVRSAGVVFTPAAEGAVFPLASAGAVFIVEVMSTTLDQHIDISKLSLRATIPP